MTKYDAPVDLDAEASAAYNDAIMGAVSAASQVIEARGHALTLNSLMGSLCAVAAYYIAGVDDQRARKALLREMEKQLPRLVAHQRAKEGDGARGKVVTLYQGRNTN